MTFWESVLVSAFLLYAALWVGSLFVILADLAKWIWRGCPPPPPKEPKSYNGGAWSDGVAHDSSSGMIW